MLLLNNCCHYFVTTSFLGVHKEASHSVFLSLYHPHSLSILCIILGGCIDFLPHSNSIAYNDIEVEAISPCMHVKLNAMFSNTHELLTSLCLHNYGLRHSSVVCCLYLMRALEDIKVKYFFVFLVLYNNSIPAAY